MSSDTSISGADGNASSKRPYKFSEHGQSTVRSRSWATRKRRENEQGSGRLQRRGRRRSSSRRRRSRPGEIPPYTVGSPDQFQLNEFAHPDRLHSVFRILEKEGGHAPGEDGLTYGDFSGSEVYGALRSVSETIRDREYRPHPTRLVEISKGNGRTRGLRLLRIMDRVVAEALHIALEGYWRSQLPGIGRDAWVIWAEMQRVMRERRAYVLATDDIRDCFPHALLDEIIRCHRRHISQPDLLWLIETVIRGHDGLGHMTGLDQGSPYSPVAMELLLHDHLDTRLEAEFRGFPLLLRYVDNLTFICSSENEGNRVLQVAEETLADLGFSLKCEERPPMDIRDSSFNRKVLGLIPRWQNGQLMFSIPESTFDDLRVSLSNALQSPAPVETARKAARGRIESLGPALVKRVVPSVVDRVISTARDCGFTELQRKVLIETAYKARKRWLELCAGTGGSGRG